MEKIPSCLLLFTSYIVEIETYIEVITSCFVEASIIINKYVGVGVHPTV